MIDNIIRILYLRSARRNTYYIIPKTIILYYIIDVGSCSPAEKRVQEILLLRLLYFYLFFTPISEIVSASITLISNNSNNNTI